MRIGIDARMINNTGIGVYIKNLIDGLSKIDKKNEYLLFVDKKGFDDYKVQQKNFTFIKIKSKIFSLGEQYELPIKICKNNLDLFHGTHFNIPILCNCSVVVTIHDLILNLFPEEINSYKKKFYYHIIMNTSLRKSKKIIAVSENTKNDIMRLYRLPKEKVEVVYEAPASRFRKINNKIKFDFIKKKYSIYKEFMLYVGLKKPHKNLVRLIEAHNILRNVKNIDIALVISGKMDERYNEIMNIIDNYELNDNVIFTGYIPDDELVDLYNLAKIFVFPSLYEGFGLPPLESMACGTPVVSSNAGSLNEILDDAAIFFDAKNIYDMADKIYQVLTDIGLRERLIKMGLSRVKNISWGKTAFKTLAIYKDIVNGKNKNTSD